MNHGIKKDVDGFVFVLAEHQETSDGNEQDIVLSDQDILRFEGVSSVLRALRNTYGKSLGSPVLARAEIRVTFVALEGTVEHRPARVAEDLHVTARQLKENAALEEPRLHSVALSHAGLGKVLEAVASAHRKSGTRLVVRADGADLDVPLLTPDSFIQPTYDDRNRRTSSFPVTGLFRDRDTGRIGFLLTKNHLPVVLPQDDPRWAWSQVHRVLEEETWMVGTIFRSSGSAAWELADDVRLEVQTEM